MNDTSNQALRDLGKHLWTRWTAMWNGETAIAEQIVAGGFQLHLATAPIADPSSIGDGASFGRWVARFRANYERITYSYTDGPFVDVADGAISAPWIAEGIFSGKSGRPEDVPGAFFRSAGIDILLFRDARIHTCWTLSRDFTALNRSRF